MPLKEQFYAMRAALLLLGVAAIVGPIFAQAGGGAQVVHGEGPFVLGVLRRDGVVLPFASYDGRRWQAPWPADPRTAELPISLDSIDRDWWGRAGPPQSLTLWAGGKPRGELTLVAPAMLRLPCGQRLGIRTNYHAAEVPPPPTTQPFPKDGLVISGRQTIDVIETIPDDSPVRQMVASAILEEFDKEENDAASGFTNWRHPVRRQDRRKIPIQVEALYRAPIADQGWTAYFVEAVRRYEPGPEDEGCGLLTTVRGWLRDGPKGERDSELTAQITYCDRYGVTFMLPLGLVRTTTGNYWVYQSAGYEREAYLISKPTRRSNERVLSYPAVVCPFRMF
jgi:hypothetical protein